MNVANQYSLVRFQMKPLDEQKVCFMLYIWHLHFRKISLYWIHPGISLLTEQEIVCEDVIY